MYKEFCRLKISCFWIFRIIIFLASFLVFSEHAWAGKMFLEYKGQLSSEYTFYRGAFDLGDLDRDGKDEMVIADDLGGFHVYKLTPAGFETLWINEPLIDKGYIAAVKIMYKNQPNIKPQIFLLDSYGTLHQIRYTGYLFEEVAKYENYRPSGQSGRLVITGVGGGQRELLIAVPHADNQPIPSTPAGSTLSAFAGMKLFRIAHNGLEPLTENELSKLKDGEIYFIQELSAEDLEEIKLLGTNVSSMFSPKGAGSDRAGVADLDRDAILELLVSVSDPKRPIDKLEIYKEEGKSYTVKITLELPLMNEMLLGDIDGDGFTEIVGLTFDGEVLVYQWDPLTIKYKDGREISWEAPHREIDGMIWMSVGGFEALGCVLSEGASTLSLTRGNKKVILDKEKNLISCGGEVLLPNIPIEMTETIQYFPLFIVLECLGFFFSYDADQDTVILENVLD